MYLASIQQRLHITSGNLKMDERELQVCNSPQKGGSED